MPLMAALVSRLRSDEHGQSNAELGLIIGVIVLVVLVALALLGGPTSKVLSAVSGPL